MFGVFCVSCLHICFLFSHRHNSVHELRRLIPVELVSREKKNKNYTVNSLS